MLIKIFLESKMMFLSLFCEKNFFFENLRPWECKSSPEIFRTVEMSMSSEAAENRVQVMPTVSIQLSALTWINARLKFYLKRIWQNIVAKKFKYIPRSIGNADVKQISFNKIEFISFMFIKKKTGQIGSCYGIESIHYEKVWRQTKIDPFSISDREFHVCASIF